MTYMNDERELITPAEAAVLFGVNVSTILRWARERKIPSYCLPSGRRRFSREDMRAALTRRIEAEGDAA